MSLVPPPADFSDAVVEKRQLFISLLAKPPLMPPSEFCESLADRLHRRRQEQREQELSELQVELAKAQLEFEEAEHQFRLAARRTENAFAEQKRALQKFKMYLAFQ